MKHLLARLRSGKCVALVRVEPAECFSRLLNTMPDFVDMLVSSSLRGVLVSLRQVSRSAALRSLEGRIVAYKVALERDPGDKRSEAMLKVLMRMYKRLQEGAAPVKAAYTLIVEAESCEETRRRAETVARMIELHGCKAKLKLVDASAVKPLLGGSASLVDTETLMEPLARIDSRIRSHGEGVYLGREASTGLPVYVSFWGENGARHMIVVGPTGRGKTTMLATLALRAYALGHSEHVVALDPKGDVAKMLGRFAHVEELSGVDASRVVAAATTTAPLSVLLRAGVEVSPPEARLLDSLRFCRSSSAAAESVKAKLKLIGLDVETLCNYRGDGGEVLGAEGGLVVYDISRLNNMLRSVLVAALLNLYYARAASLGPAEKLRMMVLVDEAWRLSRVPRSFMERIVKEGRSYGVSLTVASQDPTDFPDTMWSNASIVAAFGSHDKAYIERIGRALHLDARDVERIRWLRVGEVLLRLEWDPRPLIVRVEAEPEIVNS